MTMSAPGRPSYRWLTITLAVAAGVYAWYALGQYRRLNDLNQRQLSNAASELKASFETAQGTITEFHRKWVSQPANRPKVCEFDKGQSYLDLDECEATERAWSADLAVQPTITPTLGLEARRTISASKPSEPGRERIRFRFRTDVVLAEMAFPDAFEMIFLASGDGAVLYEGAPAQRRWLRYLRWGEQTFRDSNADRPPTLQVQNLQEMVGKDAWNKLRSVSSQTSLEIGGVPHHLYLQPLSIDAGDARLDLIIGGAVPTSTIVSDALTLDTSLVGVLVFLLLLGVLGFPFIKLVFLDPHERVRMRDVSLLYLSSGALLVLFTCGSLAWDAQVRWQALANKGLQDLAGNLKTGLSRELVAIRDQLAEYDATVSSWSKFDCDKGPVQTRWFAGLDTNETPRPGWLPGPTRPVQLRLVSWIRPDDGRQIWKATADPIPGRTPVDKRSYFRAVRDGHLFQMKDDKGKPFFFGTDRSIVNGKFYAFVSIASSLPSTYCSIRSPFDRPAVASATAQLLSLDRQPLPAGYGFALVNREGRTLYHSDPRLSLRENLFEELSEGTRARALMYANRSGPLSSRYRERPHALYLQPIELSRNDEGVAAGFYLVAFRDTSVEGAAVGRVLVEGLGGPILLLFVIFAAGLSMVSLGSRLVDRRWSAWLWPHGGLNAVYKWQAIALVVLLAAVVAAYPVFGTAVFLVTPLLASALGIGIYVLLGRHQVGRSRLTAPIWHATAITLVLVCVVVTPSAALFRMALSYEFAKLISTERAWTDAQRVDAARATEVEALEDNHDVLQARARAKDHGAYVIPVPAPYDVESPQLDAGAQGNSTNKRSPNGLQPLGADLVAVAALQGWLDAALPIDDAIASRQHGQRPMFTYSPDGTLLPSLRASSVAFVGFGLTMGLLVWWIRWNTNRLFFADEETDPAATVPSAPFETLWDLRTPEDQMVLLQIARERMANPYQRATIRRLLREGLLRLNPDLQPCSEEFDQFLQRKEHDLHGQLLTWEDVSVGHSWRYVRLALVAGVTCLGFFLIMTQPALQSSLLGIATGITGALTTGLKARDAIASWFSKGKGLPTVG